MQNISYIHWLCISSWNLNHLQRPSMNFKNIINAVIHLDRNLLPAAEAEIPKFQYKPILDVLHAINHLLDFSLQIHQPVDLLIDLPFLIYDLKQGILHLCVIPGGLDADPCASRKNSSNAFTYLLKRSCDSITFFFVS